MNWGSLISVYLLLVMLVLRYQPKIHKLSSVSCTYLVFISELWWRRQHCLASMIVCVCVCVCMHAHAHMHV